MPTSCPFSVVSNGHHSRIDPKTKDPQMSHTNLLAKSFSPHRYRAVFPDRWSQFLRRSYRNPEEVAFNFDVRFQTAQNWWNGTNRPTGDKVAMAAISRPVEFAQIMGQAA